MTNDAISQPLSTVLRGRTILVTGASRGIGAATARRLGAHGAAVGVNYHRSKAEADQVVSDIIALGSKAVAVQGNVGDPYQVNDMIECTERALGPIDTLVANAVAYHRFTRGPFEEFAWPDFQDVVIGEVAAVYFPARAIVPKMIERGHGTIIVVSSLAGRGSTAGISPHATGKAAVEGFVRALATELGPRQIRVNTVAPGFTTTDEALANMLEGSAQAIVNRTPLGRPGTPDDVAGAIVLLTMDEASWLTGNYISAGGGLYMP